MNRQSKSLKMMKRAMDGFLWCTFATFGVSTTCWLAGVMAQVGMAGARRRASAWSSSAEAVWLARKATARQGLRPGNQQATGERSASAIQRRHAVSLAGGRLHACMRVGFRTARPLSLIEGLQEHGRGSCRCELNSQSHAAWLRGRSFPLCPVALSLSHYSNSNPTDWCFGGLLRNHAPRFRPAPLALGSPLNITLSLSALRSPLSTLSSSVLFRRSRSLSTQPSPACFPTIDHDTPLRLI
jgi:hypothetical protein